MAERDPQAVPPPQRDPQAPVPALMPAGSEIYVVGIGASAGGLEACRRFLAALPPTSGMAFVLVQHLDPTHDSMMAELLTTATAMNVVQAQEGMMVAPDHLYLIPPGLYLAIAQGRISLTVPLARHGARLPFDFLLQSLAVSAGPRAACVILSGGGADGTLGAQAIKAAGGIVIAQDPAEASHPGMPESAIAAGVVDMVLPAADIAEALQQFASGIEAPAAPGTAEIIGLLKSLTVHDFTLYKTGTLDRRIARRMSMAGFGANETARYMERLRSDEDERQSLANDLLINVTSFFRDPKIFELLAATAIPELVAAAEGSIRLWVAGCSTGEETYSLAMLLMERLDSEGSPIKLQIFATDIDVQAVALAREGLYPASIERDVTPARRARFFTRDEHGYRVSAALRACVVFAVQDVLSDPPFSKLNMVSCRNLLIYLRPEAQAKVIEVFNFSLRAGGFLLLGAAETVAAPDQRFEQVSKPARLYRKLGGGRDRMPAASAGADFLRLLPRLTAKTKPADLGETCRRLLLERYAPAAVVVNARLECIYHIGATDAYLRAPAGVATHDLLAQVPPELRARLRDSVPLLDGDKVIRISGGRITRAGKTTRFDIELQSLPGDEMRCLVCFVPPENPPPSRAAPVRGGKRLDGLEAELAATRRELQQALQGLEQAASEHNAIHEEALSANEEFQSTNEELLTSKEELQSLNEELTALNSQLQESLERSRMTSTDLRNVLYSTDVPTLFLDDKLSIRFFTPSATLLFHLIASDVGRKLADFRSRADDPALLDDAARVLQSGAPSECEIDAAEGTCYLRRIQAYRTYDGTIAGVVITFTDITARKAAAAAVEEARREADRANQTKSRFLAAASHDLRQPLQTMALINGLLAKSVTDAPSQKLVARLDHTMRSIGTMLNAMLDINQIEAGIVRADIKPLVIDELLTKLHEKFRDQAAAQGIDLRIVPCGLAISTDAALLEQMLSNLVGNALKYTPAGRVLVGVRRAGAQMLRIEVWDTGIGIPADQLAMIFEEYHQIDNAARDRSLGLGLGLSIVGRLGALLGHAITLRSVPGKGSVFAVAVPRASAAALASAAASPPAAAMRWEGTLLVIEDDPDIGQLLKTFLAEEGFSVAVTTQGAAAMALLDEGFKPDLILADYNLPGGQTGLAAAQALRVALGRPVPVIIMTGDISTATLRLIAEAGCAQLNKPMSLAGLMTTLGDLLGQPKAAPEINSRLAPGERRTIYLVDDDPEIRASMRAIFEQAGKQVEDFADAEGFLAALTGDFADCCLIIDSALPGISGLDLLQKLEAAGIALPAIMVTGHGEIGIAVQAMKAGAADFLEKPVNPAELLACVRRVLDEKHGHQAIEQKQREAVRHIAELTTRQREVMERVLAGQPSKNIAADLGISQRTVENHRASVMATTGATSIPALARLAVLAAKG